MVTTRSSASYTYEESDNNHSTNDKQSCDAEEDILSDDDAIYDNDSTPDDGTEDEDDDEDDDEDEDENRNEGHADEAVVEAAITREPRKQIREIYSANVQKKLDKWGMNKRDWTSDHAFKTWIFRRTNDPRKYLQEIIKLLEDGTTMADLEPLLPEKGVSNFYWSTQPQLQKFAGQHALLVIGHCPQYEVTLDAFPADVRPEDSACLTNLIISSFARCIDIPVLSWDMRPDCKKDTVKFPSGYSSCVGIKTPFQRALALLGSQIMYLIATKIYKITFKGIWTFSSLADDFARTLHSHVNRISTYVHISRMWCNHMLTNVLIEQFIQAPFCSMTAIEVYEKLRCDLARGPGMEAGRAKVTLPTLATSRLSRFISFDDLMTETSERERAVRARQKSWRSTETGAISVRKSQRKQNRRPENKARVKAYSRTPAGRESSRKSDKKKSLRRTQHRNDARAERERNLEAYLPEIEANGIPEKEAKPWLKYSNARSNVRAEAMAERLKKLEKYL